LCSLFAFLARFPAAAARLIMRTPSIGAPGTGPQQ
jgi:hypothetical protein